jgi:hypothetical protein
MSRVLFLAAGRKVRTVVPSPTRAAEAFPIVDTGTVQPGARVAFIAADRDHGSERFDANAGCEFVDDRIRLRE